MGEAVTTNSKGISGKPENTATGATERNSSTGRTEPQRTGSNSGSGTGAGTGTATKTESIEKPVSVADVTEQQKAEARRQQKAESARRAEARRKAIENGEPIPEWAQVRTGGAGTRTGTGTKTPKAKAKEPEVLDATAIQKLIKTVFDLVATRPDAAHWKLTDEECKQLAVPIADILSEYAAASQALSQNSKYIALVMAAFAICAPRMMLSVSIKKMRKEAAHGITAKTKREVERKSAPDTAGKTANDSRNNTGTTAANGADNLSDLFDIVSTV